MYQRSQQVVVPLRALGAVLLLSATLIAQHDAHEHGESLPNSTPVEVLAQEQLEVTNPWCPVLPDEEVDPEVHSQIHGQEVFFCCRKCQRQFENDPEAYVAELPESLSSRFVPLIGSLENHAVEQGDEDADSDEHEHQHGHEDAEAGHGHDEASGEHDHSDHGHEGQGGWEAWISWLGRFHPMLVHFPIALLLVAALTRLLAVLSNRSHFDAASRVCLWLGAAGAFFAALLGWADALGVAESYSGFSAQLLLFHRWGGTLTAVVSMLTVCAANRSMEGSSAGWRKAHHLGLALCVLLVSVTGHLGASLIFGWDSFSLP